MNKKAIKNIVLKWLEKEENEHNYVYFFNEDLNSVTLDGSFDSQDLINEYGKNYEELLEKGIIKEEKIED